ncbi:hypothetical protein B0A49_03151 [Cryomyces minteri]|uniref:F-box domain-containing protein n=1 Tax=Cryomyces minteri TaxID=331657 RepID=A0A4U0XCQ7_9PEZI|nr:hypothetical protein B0A49_03151 [Cryomyces minteri]
MSLPIELQQHIFDFLDPRSFYAARKVCQRWRYASLDKVLLWTQLARLPVHLPAKDPSIALKRFLALYDQAAYVSMLGMHATEIAGERSYTQQVGKSKIAISGDGKRLAVLEDREITLYDVSNTRCSVVSRRPLNDLTQGVGDGPYFRSSPTVLFELALSYDGSLLAIALERTVQIYNLTETTFSAPHATYLSAAAGRWIAGVSFADSDRSLRVQLNKGDVLYLGTQSSTGGLFVYWSDAIKKVFLDSRDIAVISSTPAQKRLVGLQLLTHTEHGRLFAAIRDIGQGSAGYYMGYCDAVEKTATILLSLPSLHTRLPSSHSKLWLWNQTPLSSVEQPLFARSRHGNLLAVWEPGCSQATSVAGGQLFIYRLPGPQQLEQELREPRSASLQAADAGVAVQSMACGLIERVAVKLGEIEGQITDLRFEDQAPETARLAKTNTLCVKTDRCDTIWHLSDD